MSTSTVERSVEACALDAATLCEAFQVSAAANSTAGGAAHGGRRGHPDLGAVRRTGAAHRGWAGPGFDPTLSWPMVDQHDVISLVYTSRTTGPPKGVQLTHAGVIANSRALQEAIPAYRTGFSAVCYLPPAHIASRVLEHYFGLLLGRSRTCCPDVTELGTTLVQTRPTWLFGPPRMWEKLQASVMAAITVEPDDRHRRAIQATSASSTATVTCGSPTARRK
jgi:long-subunit acyl-CoA synthetase (AMP-forming)